MIRILLVDHSLGHPNSIRSLLADSVTSDFNVDSVTTFREILAGFRSKAYDVCIIDSLMANGLKLFAQARSLGFPAPIVLVISDSVGTAVQAMRNGVADCLVREELSAFQIERSVCYVVEQARNSLLQTQRERRHLALLDNSRDIVYTHDLDGYLTSMNRAGERMIGYSQTEILAMRIGQIVASKYRGLVEEVVEQTLDAQAQVIEHVELLTRYGGNFAVELNTHPIQHLGRTIEIQVVARLGVYPPHFEGRSEQIQFRSNHDREIFCIPDSSGTIGYPFQ